MSNTKYEFAIGNSQVPNSIIKIIGVGGGGGNAVNYMYRQGIRGVDFILCNTDAQALNSSPVPYKIQLGANLTSGLGAGANPEVGKNAALESKEEIRQLLSHNTKMAFITAGMGGGTGTGAAPVIAEICKSLGILTVGIVTMPFGFEGKPKETRAIQGIEELKKHCDTVLVILNNRIMEYYGGKTSVKEAFNQADSVLTKAAKAIAEIITVEGLINVDFEDVKTVMKNSGAAVMGSHTTEGENRALRAAEGAINSPLLNNTNIRGAKKILLSIVAGNEDDFQMEELEQITNFIQERAGDEAEVIYGQAFDPSLNKALSVTIIATGFDPAHHQNQKTGTVKPVTQPVEKNTPVIDLESDRAVKHPTYTLTAEKDFFGTDDDDADDFSKLMNEASPIEKPANQHEKIQITYTGQYEVIKVQNKEEEKRQLMDKYKNFSNSTNLKPASEYSNEELKNLQEVPAYMRAGGLPPEDNRDFSRMSKVTLNLDNETPGNNRFLHNQVD